MRGYLRTFVLFAVLTLFLVGIGQIVGYASGYDWRVTLAIMLPIVLIINFVAYFFSDKMVLRSTRARVVTPEEAPRLHAIVDRVVLRAEMPKPRVAIMPSMTPNAFATGRSPKHAVVAATEGILQLMTDDELEAVLAHEISHVKNRDVLIMTIASAIAAVISHLAFLLIFARNRDANPLVAILLWILAPIAAMIIQLAISRSREYAADASGARLLGQGQSLARALQKLERGVEQRPMRQGNPATSSLFIVNPFRGASMVNMFRTHPSTADRVRRLEELRF